MRWLSFAQIEGSGFWIAQRLNPPYPSSKARHPKNDYSPFWSYIHMGGCQNYGPFLGTLNIRYRIAIRIQKGAIILTTAHIYIYIYMIPSKSRYITTMESGPKKHTTKGTMGPPSLIVVYVDQNIYIHLCLCVCNEILLKISIEGLDPKPSTPNPKP